MMPTSDPASEAGITAIEHSRRVGFRFTHLRSADEVVAIHAERQHDGVIDTYTVRAPEEAYAARFRAEEFGSGTAMWEKYGSAAEVISAVLDLPPPE